MASPPIPAIPLHPCTGEDAHLRVCGLGLKRGDRWLFRHMDWELPRGKFIALVGPSGVGKTSLLGVLAGILSPTEGEATYCCDAACHHPAADFQKRMGIIFQHLRLVPNQDLLSNVLCGRLGRYPWWRTTLGFPRRDKQEAYAILHDLGLGKDAYRWVAETSGGEQQRTAAARALFQQPEIILADEPVSNLDTYFAGRVLGLLRERAHRDRLTVVCVLHDAALVHRFADLVLSLDPQNPEGWRIRENQPHLAA